RDEDAGARATPGVFALARVVVGAEAAALGGLAEQALAAQARGHGVGEPAFAGGAGGHGLGAAAELRAYPQAEPRAAALLPAPAAGVEHRERWLDEPRLERARPELGRGYLFGCPQRGRL